MSTTVWTTGSSWDAGTGSPDEALPQHLAEWVDGSAVAPELAAANLQSLQGQAVLEALAGARLEALGGHASQYATGAVARLLRPLEPIAAAGGWWCSGLDLIAPTAWPSCQLPSAAGEIGWQRPMAWGCFKPDAPRQSRKDGQLQWNKDGTPELQKYEHPIGTPTRCWWLKVPAVVAQLVADRHGLTLPPAVLADSTGDAGAFWRWWAQTPALPLLITEGTKKAAALLSAGIPAVALPGIWNGSPKNPDTGRPELLADLAAVPLQDRPVWVLFDKPKAGKRNPDEPKAARRLGRLLAKAGAAVLVGIVPGTHGKGADDHLSHGGTWEQLAAALQPLAPLPVLPNLRPADRLAPAGQYLGQACPLPSPDQAPLVVLQAPMGCGKSQAVAAAVTPLLAAGVPLLPVSHRVALGQALAELFGVPWAPAPGSDQRQLGAGLCLDSLCPSSGLRINPHSWSGAVVVLDEWVQQLEHLLMSTGTALARRRPEAMRTLAELLARSSQSIASDAQLSDWAVTLLERLTGRRALLIRSDHQPMKGRPLHCPAGLNDSQEASAAFRVKWRELVLAGQPFLCWTTAQKAGMKNAGQTLAIQHRRWRPDDLVEVIDSSTPELAAELAADPDGFAERRDAEARRLGVSWALYCSPAISSGISFQRWRPACVIALAGGRIAPEHVTQAVARVRSPQVPAYVFAPERCPGAGLRADGASDSTDPAQLIRDLRAVGDPLLGQLEDGGADGAWLVAWAQLAAQRNRQRFAYRATIAALLEREGWQLQTPEPQHPDAEADAKGITLALGEITELAQWAEDQAVIEARPINDREATELAKRRQLEPADRAALQRYRLAERWGLEGAPPTQAVIEADRDGLRDRLRLGWLLTTPEALALVPQHDRAKIAALDASGRPFAPDRLRVALAPRIAALQALGLPQLLERFAKGETIAATDPAVVALHANATACRGQLAAAAGVSPAKLATGTLRTLLRAVGWELQRAGRIKARGSARDVLTYRAQRVALPQGVNAEALAATWLEALKAAADRAPGGALFAPSINPYRGQKCPSSAPPPPPAAAAPPCTLELTSFAQICANLEPAGFIPWPSGCGLCRCLPLPLLRRQLLQPPPAPPSRTDRRPSGCSPWPDGAEQSVGLLSADSADAEP